MNLKNGIAPEAASSDADLVFQSVNGNREAFGQIVSRYQSLICSLAYSATGSLGQSEDLAQETFITAWKHLGHLREYHKLKSWLCGIARNRINSALRREGHKPLSDAEPLEAADEIAAPQPQPPDLAMAREEEALLWRTLERIPEVYREPLILFYREQLSVEKVADALELNQDTVKQRLSRGRKMLHREVLSFVEGALQRTNPGKAFTVGVIAALPLVATSAKAATFGAAAVKGTSAAKASVLLGLTGVFLGPLIGIIAGWLGAKTSIDKACSEREKKYIYRIIRITLGLVGAFAVAQIILALAVSLCIKKHILLITVSYILVTFGYAATLAILIFRWNRGLAKIREEEGTTAVSSQFYCPYNYRSPWSFLGLPLVHIQTGKQADGRTGFAKGWIAIGDRAAGFIACGGISLGVMSLGGCSVGLISLGGVAIGALSMGGFAIGAWAIGGAALGWLACGGCAVAWEAAKGGMAAAHWFSVGGSSHAIHANDDLANEFMNQNYFMSHGDLWLSNSVLVCWLPLVMVVWQAMRIRKVKKSAGMSKPL